MLRTSFSKYLTAFVTIILLSFVILSGIITAMVRTYAFSDTERRLGKECEIIVGLIHEGEVDNIEDEVLYIYDSIEPMISFNSDYDVIITDGEGNMLLSTAHSPDADNKEPIIDIENGLGKLDMTVFDKQTDEKGETVYVYNGEVGGALSGKYMVYAKAIERGGEIEGYVMTMTSTNRENEFVSITRRVVINSSIWVMIAAVVAAYFITDRIVKPLKKMTVAAKKFAKGDFSARVTVSKSNDEVAELGKAFNNMADSLESLEKMRNSFLANVSHDLRTPMTTIAGFIDGINSGAIPPEKHEYYLGIISAEVHRLSRLVSQLLDVSRLESGERKFNFTDFDIAEVARIILISFEQKIEAKHLDVEFDAEFDGMYAHADKDAIYQVVYNLCHNAIKFARDGGKFRIRINRITDTKLKVSVYNQGETLSDEDTKLVFDRFFKSDKSRGLDKSGVGLGLYICKTIIDAHGETIGVESGGSDGCEFWFTVTEGSQPQKRKAAQITPPEN